MKTNIYHVSFAPATCEVSLFFWGCNFHCRGCLCQKEIRNYLLKENLHLINEEPKSIAEPPERFLDLNEVIQILENLEVKTVLLEGQEASLDPVYPELTRVLHQKFSCRNILCTNAYKLPPLADTDELQVSLKAYSDDIHREHTGKSNKRVQQNFIELKKSGKKVTASSVLIPGYIGINEIECIARFVAGVDRDIAYHILPYFKAGENAWRRPTPAEMEEAAVASRKHLNRVYGWRGDEAMTYEVIRLF